MERRPRNPSLDLLRFVAIALVMGRHLDRCPDTYPQMIRNAFTLIRRGGWIGVDLFFVLSGFLISGLLYSEFKREGTISPLRFYVRRGLKIYPSFYLMIGFTLVLGLFFGGSMSGTALLSELLFFQSYSPGIWNHTWSLAVEEHFYIVLPLFFLLLLRLNHSLHLVPLSALAIGIGCLAARIATCFLADEYSHLINLYATHLRIDSLFFGVMIGYFYHFHNEAFVQRLTPWRYWLVAAGSLMLTPAYMFQLETTTFIYTGGLTLFYLASGAMLTGMVLSKPSGWLVVWLAWLGECSYSTYLWHVPVKRWLTPESLPFAARVGIFVLGSFVIGVSLTKWFEDPILNWRNRRWPSKSGATALESEPAYPTTK
jgi:peptidoglycan/LPS O-acetylase OafA/YrhL